MKGILVMNRRLFLMTTLLLLVITPAVHACVCDTLPTATEALAEADAVFSGKYVGAEYRKGIVDDFRESMVANGEKKTDYEVLVLKFEVEQWWKGNAVKEVILITGQSKDADGSEAVSDCDSHFDVGERYLVYAYKNGNGLSTSPCTRTSRLKKAGADLKLLRQKKRVKTTPQRVELGCGFSANGASYVSAPKARHTIAKGKRHRSAAPGIGTHSEIRSPEGARIRFTRELIESGD
jgi:hypothetical protein